MVSRGIWTILQPRNFANWPAEYGKICRGKLWALHIVNTAAAAATNDDFKA